MRSKNIIITGGNAGIGKATAIGLAKQGHRIYIACRNQQKGAAAVADIKAASKNENIAFISCDLASFDSIRTCAKIFQEQEDRLDILINNAGLITSELKYTKEGYEQQFGVNHLGPFLLTQLLVPQLQTANKPRIVNVSSKAHYSCKAFDFEDLKGEKSAKKGYDAMKAYSQSKLANVLFTKELTKKYPWITSNCLHPGVVRTQIANKDMAWYISLFWSLAKPFFISTEKGAETSIYLATAAEIEGNSGGYFDKKKEFKPSKLGRDEDLAQQLWAYSENAIS